MGMLRVPSGMITSTRLPVMFSSAAALATTSWTCSWERVASAAFLLIVIVLFDAASIATVALKFRRQSFRLLKRQAAFVSIGEVGHVSYDGRTVAEFDRR